MSVHALTIDLEDWHQLFHRRLTAHQPHRPTLEAAIDAV
jgi:hypothetical protein